MGAGDHPWSPVVSKEACGVQTGHGAWSLWGIIKWKIPRPYARLGVDGDPAFGRPSAGYIWNETPNRDRFETPPRPSPAFGQHLSLAVSEGGACALRPAKGLDGGPEGGRSKAMGPISKEIPYRYRVEADK